MGLGTPTSSPDANELQDGLHSTVRHRVYKLLGPYDCIAVVSRFERSITDNTTIVTDYEYAVLSHRGEVRPGEQSHSLI